MILAVTYFHMTEPYPVRQEGVPLSAVRAESLNINNGKKRPAGQEGWLLLPEMKP